ncbi:transposable element Tcb2 transposase [Trichonephila clavipes]|nr:transposable element Tcb2 transposase [Trichonephila clavipes]
MNVSFTKFKSAEKGFYRNRLLWGEQGAIRKGCREHEKDSDLHRNPWSETSSALSGIVHYSIGGNRPALPHSGCPRMQRSMEQCYKHLAGRIWNRFLETGSAGRRPGQGRRRATTQNEDHYLVLKAPRHQNMNATLLQQHLRSATGTTISTQTVRNRLHGVGLYPR